MDFEPTSTCVGFSCSYVAFGSILSEKCGFWPQVDFATFLGVILCLVRNEETIKERCWPTSTPKAITQVHGWGRTLKK